MLVGMLEDASAGGAVGAHHAAGFGLYESRKPPEGGFLHTVERAFMDQPMDVAHYLFCQSATQRTLHPVTNQ
jgi:hypothetical protein